ncbi:MAG TPA: metal ABC transporter permease [Ktedonobacterales bacterium]|nr:metal ABC transporter permease [Ktedonobacterales bacterium]
MPEGAPSWNLVADLQDLLRFHFMQNALLAGTIVAVVAGLVGYFMVIRSASFAGHTLANVGFAGAAGAALVGVTPVVGLLAFGMLAALGIGALGARSSRGWNRSEVAVGTILALALGLGLLFERLATVSANYVYAVLFGSVLGISDAEVAQIALMSALTLVALALLGRPLLFASLDPEVAAARGVPVRLLSYLFLALLAFAVAEAVQVTGVLLIFALLVTPAATALQLSARPACALALAAAIGLLVTYAGLVMAYYMPYPVGFFITTFAFGLYLVARITRAGMRWFALRRGDAGQVAANGNVGAAL